MNDVKVTHYIWEGKVPDWRKCKECGREWTPWSLNNGICPVCRGYEPPRVYSKAIEILKDYYYNKQGKYDDYVKEVLSNEDNLIKCGKCSRLVMDGIRYAGLVVCDECYRKAKYMDLVKKQNTKKTVERGGGEDETI